MRPIWTFFWDGGGIEGGGLEAYDTLEARRLEHDRLPSPKAVLSLAMRVIKAKKEGKPP